MLPDTFAISPKGRRGVSKKKLLLGGFLLGMAFLVRVFAGLGMEDHRYDYRTIQG
jgi:hypothetical protein